MKEATIITSLNQMANRIKRMEEAQQNNIKEIMKNQAAISLTIEAVMNLLIAKGLVNGEAELKEYIQGVHAKRSEKAVAMKEQILAQQPVFNTESSVPAPGEEAEEVKEKEAENVG